MNAEKIKTAAALIRESSVTVALTGAGISTPSGIPDFRSPQSGLWTKVDPMEVGTIDAFMRSPKRFYDFLAPLTKHVSDAQPNPAHTALAELEAAGRLRSVITQNIDNLHQRAGSRSVIELHGNGQHYTCIKCRRNYLAEEAAERFRDGVPRCECDGTLKPDVVLFGESLPIEALTHAQRDSGECTLMLVVGSSLTVMPASFLPQIALQSGARIVVVNLQPTFIDEHASVVFHDHVEEVLPEIVRELNAAN